MSGDMLVSTSTHSYPVFVPTYLTHPRRLGTYKITPRSKRPPNWQHAQRFVKALVVEQIGPAPKWHAPNFAALRYHSMYKRIRNAYMVEDFPINP